jgi:hypothetical protein
MDGTYAGFAWKVQRLLDDTSLKTQLKMLIIRDKLHHFTPGRVLATFALCDIRTARHFERAFKVTAS